MLLAAVLLGSLVEVVVPAGHDAHLVDGAVLGTCAEDAGDVGLHLLAVVKLTQKGLCVGVGSNQCRNASFGLVLQAQLGFSLEACCHVPVLVDSVVDANDGSHAEARLVAVQVDTVVCDISSASGSGEDAGNGGNRIADSGLHEAIVVTCCIHAAQAYEAGQVVHELIRGAQRQAEVVLAALHVAVQSVTVVCCCSGKRGSDCSRNAGSNQARGEQCGQCRGNVCCKSSGVCSFKRADTLVELTLAATAAKGDASVYAPFIFVVTDVNRRNHGSQGIAFELVGGVGIVEILCKQGESGGNVTTLLGELPVGRNVPAVAQEGCAGRVEVDAGDVDDGILAHLAQEGCVLV